MPETQPTPRVHLNLNGSWQLQPSNEISPPLQWTHSVPVPSLVDLASPSYDWTKFRYHWYRTTFDVPEITGQLFIVIRQAMFGTDVWVNGEHLGRDIACYTSQEYSARDTMISNGTNELIVRVGQREHLPPESAVGKDQERKEWVPGIWGDVYLLQCGNPKVKHVQVIPHVERATAEVRVTVENTSPAHVRCVLTTRIVERKSGVQASEQAEHKLMVGANATKTFVCKHLISGMCTWSPESPFLYEVETTVRAEGKTADRTLTAFGMREFSVVGSEFRLNGKRIFLRGGNIAFHRFLSDAERARLPWSDEWIKRALIDIPKAHNFNFFRAHIGQMYDRWYEIADEYGMLIQNEWQFWTASGTREQIHTEFTRWLQDNWNHPSIIIWDALNESSDEIVQKEIVPEMKGLDPTRPWESVDFVEDHPYIYSLGPVLHDRKFGFTRSLEEIEKSAVPSVVNEFLWWWLDKSNNPTELTKEVAERWLGPRYTPEELVAHQSFLAQELVELFRRIRVDAIQPFVYLSNNGGPTGHWFLGDIKDLRPKPVLEALRNAFSPFGISVELWDRHFVAGEQRTVRLFVFNDHDEIRNGVVSYGLVNGTGEWVSRSRADVSVESMGCTVVPISLRFPDRPGPYKLRAELFQDGASHPVSYSEKTTHVFGPLQVPGHLHNSSVAVLEGEGELSEFLSGIGIRCQDFLHADLAQCGSILVGAGLADSSTYQRRIVDIHRFLQSGKVLMMIEPEFGVRSRRTIPVADRVSLTIESRPDVDRGGYDSYVFPEDHRHPIWSGIDKEHLKMFNGAFGGEIVSQHDVSANVAWEVLARCGLKLRVIAASEMVCEKGKIVISRLQLRGRLEPGSEPDSLYARRVDPVLQRYLLNVLSYAARENMVQGAI